MSSSHRYASPLFGLIANGRGKGDSSPKKSHVHKAFGHALSYSLKNCSIPVTTGARPLGGSPGFGIDEAGSARYAFMRLAIEISPTAAEIPGRSPGKLA